MNLTHKQKDGIIIVVGLTFFVVCVVGLAFSDNINFYFYELSNKHEIDLERQIVNQVTPLVGACKTLGDNGTFPSIQGNIIIWDLDKQFDGSFFHRTFTTKSDVKLPNGYAGVAADNQLTVLLILDKGGTTSKVSYTGGDIDYITPYCDLAVVYWPSLTPVGFYHYDGITSPPSSFEYNSGNRPTAIYGDLKQNLEQWFANQLPSR